jgi:hypothetical protein
MIPPRFSVQFGGCGISLNRIFSIIYRGRGCFAMVLPLRRVDPGFMGKLGLRPSHEFSCGLICTPLYSRWIYSPIVKLLTLPPSTKCKYSYHLRRKVISIFGYSPYLPAVLLRFHIIPNSESDHQFYQEQDQP